MSRNGAEEIFRIENVSYVYQGKHSALIGVDLSVAKGERLVILGANGCGKSTLLKIMDGLLAPTDGLVTAFGEDASGLAADARRSQSYHRRVGFVFQDSDVQLFSPTVWDDVVFGPLQMGWSADEVKSRGIAAMQEMGVGHLADRAPYELSDGLKKRVAIATVLAIDPEVLLMDEPTASLDPRSKAALVDLIVRLGDAGRTLVITTQELEIVPSIATRVVVFGDNEKCPIAQGTPQEILNDQDLLVTANLIHEHLHYHGAEAHAHHHTHSEDHDHEHD